MKIFSAHQMNTMWTALHISCYIFLVPTSWFFDGSYVKFRPHIFYCFKRRPSLTNIPIVPFDTGRSFAIFCIPRCEFLDNFMRTMSTSLLMRTVHFLPGMAFSEVHSVFSRNFMEIYAVLRDKQPCFKIFLLWTSAIGATTRCILLVSALRLEPFWNNPNHCYSFCTFPSECTTQKLCEVHNFYLC